DEAADMLGEMTREGLDLCDERAQFSDPRIVDVDPRALECVGADRTAAHAPDRGGECPDRVLRQAEDLADFADGRATAVGDHGRADARALATITAIDVLDHLLAPFVLEIDVDVGRLVAVGGNEAFEQKVVQARIDLRDAETETYR